MTEHVHPPRPSELWKGLSDARRLEAAQAFWSDEQSYAEQAEVIGLIARQINFRPKSVLAMPVDKKVAYLTRTAKVSDTVAARLLVSYHLAKQRPMMASFLDSLGIKHEDGLIAEEDVKAPDSAVVAEAGRQLLTAWPPEDVRLYFSTLVMQDPGTWGALAPLATPESEPSAIR
jgi:hypothetical protein